MGEQPEPLIALVFAMGGDALYRWAKNAPGSWDCLCNANVSRKLELIR